MLPSWEVSQTPGYIDSLSSPGTAGASEDWVERAALRPAHITGVYVTCLTDPDFEV